MNEPLHSKAHSEMMDLEAGPSQDQSAAERSHKEEVEEQAVLLEEQCHVGTKSVKSLIHACWPSKNQATETNNTWKNCLQLNPPMHQSIIMSRDSGGVESLAGISGSEEGFERRGVEADMVKWYAETWLSLVGATHGDQVGFYRNFGAAENVFDIFILKK